MFYTSIHIDLPSERVLRRRTLLEWLAGVIGREVDLRTSEEVATASGLSVFKAVTDALAELGITDVLSVIVDGKTAFVDIAEDSGDLDTAVAELDARAALESEFEVMTLVLNHRAEGLRTLVEIELRRRVEFGKPELDIRTATRCDAMQIERGEGPAMYAARLREFAADVATLARARDRVAKLGDELERALDATLGELAESTTRDPVALRLIRPGPRALDHMRRLSWGSTVRMPDYRPVPIVKRHGAYDEPFSHHYFDPYFDFAAYVTLVEIVAERGWRGLAFEVVDADGSLAFDHGSAAGRSPVAGNYALDEGQPLVEIKTSLLVIDDVIPRFEGVDPGEVPTPSSTPGYAGGERNIADQHAFVDVAGGVSNVSGGDLGGSCGASCGGCGGG